MSHYDECMDIDAYASRIPEDPKPISRCDGNEIVDINVERPKHYALFPAMDEGHTRPEAISVIASSMTVEMFYGYCFGNSLKYRLRAGKKGDLVQDINKSGKYERLFEENKHLCTDGEIQ